MRIDPGRAHRELDQRRLADDDRPRALEQAGDCGVGRCDVVFQDDRSAGRDCALHVDQVLEGDRDPVHRPAVPALLNLMFRLACLRERAFREPLQEGVQAGFEAFDAVQRRLYQLNRRQVARADMRREFIDRGVGQIIVRHGQAPGSTFHVLYRSPA